MPAAEWKVVRTRRPPVLIVSVAVGLIAAATGGAVEAGRSYQPVPVPCVGEASSTAVSLRPNGRIAVTARPQTTRFSAGCAVIGSAR